ncbi:DNA methylase (plasmid) [Chondrocystis sp. NIES-4102]|nr:DNA methylase [Chondrocystis sp. NIES-4102]
MVSRKKTPKTEIESVKHKDKRANIPTEELRGFLSEEEKQPKTLLYPRDPSLDPQLVWQTKDEQDSQDLEVTAVPIYIQEKIHPQAIIDDFRHQVKKEQAEQQLSLFGDFNGLEFEKLIDFYQHKDGVKWTNRMILGDSLSVMGSLAEKEGLKGQVQMIYIDPPYGIKFGSNWQVSTLKRDVKDGNIGDVTRQPEQVKAFRDTWELGIHSYLSYMRDRLVVARELLTETGSVFVQIGDENVHLVRCLMDEIFGGENFVSLITFRKTTGVQSNYVASVSDYLLWYAKDKEKGKFRSLYRSKENDDNYCYFMNSDGSYNRVYLEQKIQLSNEKNNTRIFRFDHLLSSGASKTEQNFEFQKKVYRPPTNNHWKTNIDGMQRLAKSGRIYSSGKTLSYIRYLHDFGVFPYTNFWDDTTVGGSSDRYYVVQTSPKVIERCLLMTTDPGDLVLDPTMGSATTAYVAEQWGRRWITIDTSRVALALARTRLMSAQYPYYLLADSSEGIAKETAIAGQIPPANPNTDEDIKKGFVYKRVPHITLGAIANNPEIDTIHEKWQKKLEPIHTQLNELLKKSWEEWEVPREPENKWSDEAKNLLQEWWKLKCDRQNEIDESIARNSDSEILYDQPYDDKKRIRVTGPFTVESLSPHRVLSTNEERPASEAEGIQQASDNFEIRIIENLKKAGVQNGKKDERLKFEYLEPYPGTWIQAEGEYVDKDGTTHKVGISIGSEYGTVGSDQIKEAAKEAVQGLGYDLLIVCGFAFDPGVSEQSKRFGKLQILVTRMNTDLLLGDEMLKKTGSGNLFMVFGEPDIEIKRLDDGKITVELKGLDIYDPTTGEIRSSSTKDIACWFIDTNYNDESFFVRHAYFTGADEPYKKLKKTLKAEVDEDAWDALYSDISRPFDAPQGKKGKPGKIAVKVINHYGDEVLKVYEA